MGYKQILAELKVRSQASDNHAWGTKLQTLKALDAEAHAADYLFEFWAYLRIAGMLVDAVGGTWQVLAPAGQAVAVWPMAPGNPENFSCIEGQIHGVDVHIRPGVTAQVKGHGMAIAPDISLRLKCTGAPADAEVVRIWDASFIHLK